MQYMQCIKDQYVQHWHASCLRNKKLEHSVNYKNIQTERYIIALNIDKFRCCWTKFGTSNNCLMVEIRGYYNTDESYRTCVYCDAYVEDVYYFVLICPMYKKPT